jgi:GxxExxY protein
MWDTLKKAETWSGAVIGAAIEVRRIEGPGLIEGIYKKCFGRECELRQIPYVNELEAQLEYKGFVFEEPLRLDFLIDDVLILEFKAVQELLPIHQAPTDDLHEAPQKTAWPLVQFSRTRPKERDPPVGA